MHSKEEPRYAVVWPLARKAAGVASAAKAVSDLSGKTVAELWDYIFRGDAMYATLRDLLRERFPGIRFVDYSQFGNIHGPKQRDIVAGLADKLRELQCDAVISGIGA